MQTCNLCQRAELETLIEFGAHPIAHRFVTDASLPEYTHPVTLAYCKHCGLAQLADPIPPGELYAEYTVLSSWKPEPHIPELIRKLSALPGLGKDASVIEAGSNDGVFLAALHEHGWTNIIGIEPAADAYAAAIERGAPTIHEYFNADSAARLLAERGPCDLFIARQVLEHIGNIPDFLGAMAAVLRPGGYVFFEVPNNEMSFRELDYSGVWEEHVNYFTPDTLGALCASVGIEIIDMFTTRFSGEILSIMGRYTGQTAAQAFGTNLKSIEERLFAYRDSWPRFRTAITEYLTEHRKDGGKAVVFGAGCRACGFINFTGIGPLIDFVVDDQPGKQGKLMPGSHLPIRPSAALKETPIDLCLLAVNAENDEKVIYRNKQFAERGGKFVSILPPSDHLPDFWNSLRS